MNSTGSSEQDISTVQYVMDIDHCILQSNSNPVFDYGENYVSDPLINDPENGDFSLKEFSHAIGLGTDEYYNPFSEDNEDNNKRELGPIIPITAKFSVRSQNSNSELELIFFSIQCLKYIKNR